MRLLLVLLALAAARSAGASEIALYRPMLADLRESLMRGGVHSMTQDIRYGSDILDSTSSGGWIEDQRGVGWSLAGGRILRTPPWENAFGRRGPWRRYQLTASGMLLTTFERFGAQYVTVTDFQFGAGTEARWTGPAEDDAAWSSGAFDRPVVTTRTGFYHRSSHTGDEYLAQGHFGRNQFGPGLFAHPPIKRVKLSYELIQQLVAVEWSPTRGASTWRAYAGGEWKLGTMGRSPWNLRSPAAQLGLEFRSAGNRGPLGPDPFSTALNRVVGGERFAFTWFAAVDLKLAKPFNFAGVDNPHGETEVWTPHLWSEGVHGREFRRYAGSWHAMAGVGLWNRARRSVERGGRLLAGETAITLQWYRGYSPHGTFLDMRRRDHPRWHVVPAVTTTF